MSTRRERAAEGVAGVGALVLHVVLPVAIGGIVYVGWRTRGLLLWDWAAEAGLDDAFGGLRDGLFAAWPAPPEWVRFSLPDALWVYALTWGVARLQRASSPRVRALWLAVPALLGPGAELLQLVGLPGTFDALDLILCLFAFALGAALGLSAPRSARAA